MHSSLMKGGYNPPSSGRSVSSDSGATAALGCAPNVCFVELSSLEEAECPCPSAARRPDKRDSSTWFTTRPK